MLEGHCAAIACLDIIQFQQRLLAISSSEDGTAQVWDVATGNCLQTFKDHHASGQSLGGVALSRNGDVAATAGMDTTVRIWDMVGGECLDHYKAGDPVTCRSRIDQANPLVCGTLCGDAQFLTIRDLEMPALRR